MGDLRDLSIDEQIKIAKERRRVEQAAKPIRKKPRLDIRAELGLDVPSEDLKSVAITSDAKGPDTPLPKSNMAIDARTPTQKVLDMTSTSEQSEATGPRKTGFVIPKRTATETPSAYSEIRRKPKTATQQGIIIPKSTMDGGTNNSVNVSETESPFTEKLALPDWLKRPIPNSHATTDRSKEIRLQQLKGIIANCLSDKDDETKLKEYYDKIRSELHVYEHFDVADITVKRSKLLDVQGLPQLFLPRKDGFKFPFDIKADAMALHVKWCREDFDPNIMRGLIYSQNAPKDGKAGRHTTKIAKNYEKRANPKFFGPGDLVSGQWWPVLLAAMRDGAHGDPQAGISRLENKGAYSILVSGSHYDDKDEGDTIHYCGTEGKEGKISEDTKALHDNIRTGNVVRVLRSSKLPKENSLRPELGFRYDGVYQILSYEVLDARLPHHRFLLKRVEGQDPIRSHGIGARPTRQDKEAFLNHKALSGS